MSYLKIIILKIARFFAVMIGNIIRFFRGNKHIDLKNIRIIIFNRKDRIGDAVITKPFIILFSKYVKDELKLNIDIEVECSKYNEFVFKEGNGEKYYKLINSDEQISNVGISIFKLLKQQLKNLFTKQSKNISKKNTVYIDLVGNPDHVNQRKNNLNYYFIGPNLFFNNLLLDYSLSENYVSGVKINLIQSYINLISGCFKLDNFEEYINNHIEAFYFDYNNSKNKKGILVFTGNKEYRNLSIKTRENLIKNLSENYNDKKITVIDDNHNIIYNGLNKATKFPKNVELVKNEFTLQELKEQAKNYELIVGIDGGGFNYIRTCTDSITIYTIGNHYVWPIFTGKEKNKKEKLGNHRIMNNCRVNGKNFGYVYKKNFILPTYDSPVLKKIFSDIPTISIKQGKI